VDQEERPLSLIERVHGRPVGADLDTVAARPGMGDPHTGVYPVPAVGGPIGADRSGVTMSRLSVVGAAAERVVSGPPREVVSMSTTSDAMKFRADLLDLTERLIADLDWAPAGRVMATVVACRSDLSRGGVQRDGLLVATETCVRSRLQPPARRSR
jgi:hypothetical protein